MKRIVSIILSVAILLSAAAVLPTEVTADAIIEEYASAQEFPSASETADALAEPESPSYSNQELPDEIPEENVNQTEQPELVGQLDEPFYSDEENDLNNSGQGDLLLPEDEALPDTYFPEEAFSAGDIIDRGYCGGEGDGTNLSWKLGVDRILTISGT